MPRRRRAAREPRVTLPAMASRGRPYRTIVIEGFEILVGRGERENDALTFEVADPHDLWLHVAGGVPGSHVVVRNPRRVEVPPPVIVRAAELAAWFSRSRRAREVKVHVCFVSEVSKPRDAPAGLVELARWSSVKVKPTAPDAPANDNVPEA